MIELILLVCFFIFSVCPNSVITKNAVKKGNNPEEAIKTYNKLRILYIVITVGLVIKIILEFVNA